MDTTIADARTARRWLNAHGWVPGRAEHFRVLPPPPGEVWLGAAHAGPSDDYAGATAGDAGWTVQCLDADPQVPFEAAVLDALDPLQRIRLLAGLPLPGVESDGRDDDAAPFAWAHRALCRQGLKLRVGPGPGRGPGPRPGADPGAGDGANRAALVGEGTSPSLSLRLQHRAGGAVEAPLLVLEVAAGVRCRLVETHAFGHSGDPGSIVQNLQIHIRLEEGASLQYVRHVPARSSDRIAHFLQVSVGREARFELATIATGSRYQLHRQQIGLQAPGAVGRSAGLVLCDGTTLDQQFRVAHLAPDTTSDVEALALGSGAALGVLDAYTRIAPDAARANVRQRLTGIPTAGRPRFVMRPHLEILNDQVQAVHGATWGALPEDAIFYARQRGLDGRAARGLIIRGMADALMRRAITDAAAFDGLGIDALLQSAVSAHLESDKAYATGHEPYPPGNEADARYEISVPGKEAGADRGGVS